MRTLPIAALSIGMGSIAPQYGIATLSLSLFNCPASFFPCYISPPHFASLITTIDGI